jgi:hypothetical protein
MTMRRMPVLAQSQTPIDVSPSADGLAPIVVTASGNVAAGQAPSNNFDSSDQVDEITVLGNRGERGWQGNDPNPTKGWRPVRDANGNLTGWERRNSQTGQKERKSVQWGEQNGLTDPGNKFELVDPGFQSTVPSTQTFLEGILSLLLVMQALNAATGN